MLGDAPAPTALLLALLVPACAGDEGSRHDRGTVASF
jgi:hypothetical protein